MALPTILVNSATGSDTAASGAGPTTALTGSAASTSADGLTVTLDGSPDLSGVATDGSAVIWLNDSTAANRTFGKITAADNTAKTVTVANAFGINLTGKGWAIGGKRASIGSASSRRLFETNGTAGDAMPGWTVEMESGHAETITSGIWWRRSGDVTDGRMTLKGTYGAATRPKITWTGAYNAILFNNGGYYRHAAMDFDVERNITNASSGGTCFNWTGGYTLIERVKVTSIGSSNWDGVFYGSDTSAIIRDCYAEKATTAVYQNNTLYCYLKNCGTGINITNVSGPRFLVGNIIHNPTNIGIDVNNTSYPKLMLNNTIYADTGSPVGIAINANSGGSHYMQVVSNNIVQGCATAIAVDGTSPNNAAMCLSQQWLLDNNVIYNCTNQITSGYENLLQNTSTANPSFTDATNGNFSVGTNMKAIGYPTAVLGYSATRSYNDPGAAQRQEPTGGGEHSYII